jgi:Protein of unknown function (DUF992)
MKLIGMVLASALVLAPVAAMARTGVNVGVLRCTVAGGMGMIIGSSKKVNCHYSGGSGHDQNYTGKISKLGIDIGVTNEAYMSWIVFAPGALGKGALGGSYAGVSAQATAGIGLGANVLIGGFEKSITLQPVSIQGQTGLNVAAGLTGLTLRSAR